MVCDWLKRGFWADKAAQERRKLHLHKALIMNHRNNKDKQKFSKFYGIVETENNKTKILDFL